MQKSYRLFLYSIIAYYITDILWGVFDHFRLTKAMFIDTELYFIAIAIGILFWTRYVVSYLRERNKYGAILYYAGIAFFAGVTVMTAINIFVPVMFRIDQDGNYVTTAGRYIILITQIILLLLSSIYAAVITVKTKGSIKQRHMAIALFDVNGLKIVNDTFGHDTGDEYIKKAFKIICKHFEHSPVFRTGGDEFVAVLEGDDYCDRQELVDSFNREVERNKRHGDVVISVGVADYEHGNDNSCKRIFDRADALMYKRKQELKKDE